MSHKPLELWIDKWLPHDTGELEGLFYTERFISNKEPKTLTEDQDYMSLSDREELYHMIEYSAYEKLEKDKASNDADYLKASQDLSQARQIISDLLLYVKHSQHVEARTLRMTTPAQSLREAADEMEKKDAVVSRAYWWLS